MLKELSKGSKQHIALFSKVYHHPLPDTLTTSTYTFTYRGAEEEKDDQNGWRGLYWPGFNLKI